MQHRDALWKDLANASDELAVAMHEYLRAAITSNRARVDHAIESYVNRLAPVIGEVVTFRYQASFLDFMAATDRRQRLWASLAGRSPDGLDLGILRQVESNSEAKLKVFKAAEAEVKARLDDAARGDYQD